MVLQFCGETTRVELGESLRIDRWFVYFPPDLFDSPYSIHYGTIPVHTDYEICTRWPLVI